MSDVLGNDPRPTPIWVVPLAVAALVVGLVVTLDLRGNDSTGATAQPEPTAQSAPASWSPSPGPTPGQAGNACGGDVTLPLVAPGTRPANTRLRLLVGDRDLRVVDVDAARTRVLSSPGNGRSYTDLRMSAHRVLAVIRNPCTADGYSDGVIAEVDPGSGELTALESGDALLPGSPTTVVDYDRQGATVLRDLGGKASTPVPQQWLPLARRGSSYAVYVLAADPGDPAALGTVGVGDPASGRLTTQYGSGSDVAASRDQVVWLAGGCDPGPCLLATTGADGIANAQPLSGRRPWSGVISPNGSQVAFRLTRTEGRLGGHPGPPNDVAVLDIRTGKLRILPGLVLPAKAGLTLAWSPDSTWLVIGADLGTRPLVMIWRTGMERPAQVQMPPTGGGTTGPPALLVL